MWISRDCVVDLTGELTYDQSLNLSCDQKQTTAGSLAWAGPPALDSSVEGVAPWEGEYEKAFETMKQIGKGAFGHVNLAQRREDQLVVRLFNIYSVL